jgi:prepilin-type N-terminal cleavage/methylation domain-containing protein
MSRPLTPPLDHGANDGRRGLAILKQGRRAVDRPAVARRLKDRACAQHGFTLIEVLVAAMVLVVGLLAMLGMLVVANKTTQTNRVRQQATNVAREAIENVRALSYTQLATPTSIAAALVPQMTPGATLSGSTLTVTRSAATGGGGTSGYSFNVTFTTCSLDDPADGYGDHSSGPASGGSWCPDVAPSGTTDSNPDDYKRVSVIVTPTGGGGAARTYPVQQTVDIYAKPVNGPAVSCLTTTTCPGSNVSVTTLGANSLTFNVTTTRLANEIQWLVNGNPPTGQDPTGDNGTYSPAGTTSSFTWSIPFTGGNSIDGTYSITAIALDANGNSGTRSTIQVTVNEHQVIAPASFNAGFDRQIGGVDIQWVPSVDQDVLYYNVYHQYNGGAAMLACSHVGGTSCTDTANMQTEAPPVNTPCTYQQPYSGGKTNVYWVVGVDRDPTTNQPRESTLQSSHVDANLCDHPPSVPSNLTGSLSLGALTLNWWAPAAPVDPDSPSGDGITAWRLYRWPASQGSTPQLSVANRLELVGAGNGASLVTTAGDPSPDPGGSTQDYCVTSVDTHLDESPCSNVWTQ